MTRPYFCFPDEDLSKCQRILTKLGTCIDMKEIWFGIAYGQILSMFDRVICPRHDNEGVLQFVFFFFVFFFFSGHTLHAITGNNGNITNIHL